MSFYDLVRSGQVLGPGNSTDVTTTRDLQVLQRKISAKNFTPFDAGTSSTVVDADDFKGGLITANPSGAMNLTTQTAAQLVAADVDAAVGSGYEVVVINLNGVNAITLVAGAGVTLVGVVTVAINSTARFYVRYTNVTFSEEAVTIYRAN